MNPLRRLFRFVSFVALAMIAAPGATHAAAPSFLVNSVLDAVDDNVNDTVCHTASGTCTLRAAIMQANRYTGTGNVAITVPAGEYVLSIDIDGSDGDDSGDLNLTAPPAGISTITISGAGAATTIIDANHIDRAFGIAGRAATITGVTVRNGNAPPGGNGGAIVLSQIESNLTLTNAVVELSQANEGGGIGNDGAVALTNVMVKSNNANFGGGMFNNLGALMAIKSSTIKSNTSLIGSGGGVFNAGVLSIDQSTISANSSLSAGGIYNRADTPMSASMTMTNSTVSDNHAQEKGGGISSFGTGSLTVGIYSSSIIGNEAAANPVSGGRGGGIYIVSGAGSKYELSNSLIAGNYLSGGASYEDCYSPGNLITAGGLNLFSTSPVATCPFANPSSVATTTLALLAIGPLQDNGGPTFTHALLPGSNAIGAVATASCKGLNSIAITVDQRGVSRVTDGFCDVGAFEYDFSRIFANGFDPP